MANLGVQPVLHVPARDIPVPAHLSAAAQRMLAGLEGETGSYPPLDDISAWRSYIAALDDIVLRLFRARGWEGRTVGKEVDISGVRVYVSMPPAAALDDGAVYLDIHGGSLIAAGGEACRILGSVVAEQLGARVWSVDYRMPPDYPYPAGLEDCVAAYRALLRDHHPEKIIVGGGSAGGNLAAALILRARDEGLPLPAAALLLSPEVDLTESGDSFHTNMGVDTMLRHGLMPANLLYAGGHDLRHPYLSPLFGDFSKGFPPTLLTAGTRDLFLSNAVRMHRALRASGIPAELHVLEAATHGGLGDSPEGEEIDREMRRFVNRYWKRAT
jgi:acetyl esterase/lipase